MINQHKSFFFCGIGGSGMLPLAMIASARGARVSGSDRSRDQGRTPEKFAWLEKQGLALFPQDGSGIKQNQIFVASAAIEDTVPDVARARVLGCTRMTRAELNAAMFNAASCRIGVAGTSGKSTVTGMIAWIMHKDKRSPTVMNGAVMRNFTDSQHDNRNAYASALPSALPNASPDEPIACHISEIDESDASIALYQPTIAIVTNISFDHKSLTELHQLFSHFAAKANTVILNADDPESSALLAASAAKATKTSPRTFGFAHKASFRASNPRANPASDSHTQTPGCTFDLHHDGKHYTVELPMLGRHNISNALAAIAACHAAHIAVPDSVAALADFAGIARRYEKIGAAKNVTVIDDFAHNPDKIAATLSVARSARHTLTRSTKGRILIFFQPHGYGPLRQMGGQLAISFATGMRSKDKVFLCDPVYFGGTVDRSSGSKSLAADIIAQGSDALYLPTRAQCGAAMIAQAQPGDTILVLGARDDSLTQFARDLLSALAASDS